MSGRSANHDVAELDRRATVIAETQAELDRRAEELRAREADFESRRRDFERERKTLERELDEARRAARDAGVTLNMIEAQRAYDVDALDQAQRELKAAGPAISKSAARRLEQLDRELMEAHETIRWMQRTRVWRIGSAWWRFRGRIFGRR